MTERPEYRHIRIADGIYLHMVHVPMKLAANEYGVVQILDTEGHDLAYMKQSPGFDGVHQLSLSHIGTQEEIEVQVMRATVEPWYPFARPIDFIRDEIKRRLAYLHRRHDDDDEWWDDD